MPQIPKFIAWLAVAVSAFGIAGYAALTYTLRPLGDGVHPEMKIAFNAHRFAILLHIFASIAALATGPWQFLPALRSRRPALHRTLGKVYLLIGVLLGGLSGLYVSLFAFGGIISTLGFATLAILWLLTGTLAFRAALLRDFPSHRRWMIRNFALALAAVSLRIGLGLGFAFKLPFELFYPALSWLSWIINAIIAEGIILSWRCEASVRTSGESPR